MKVSRKWLRWESLAIGTIKRKFLSSLIVYILFSFKTMWNFWEFVATHIYYSLFLKEMFFFFFFCWNFDRSISSISFFLDIIHIKRRKKKIETIVGANLCYLHPWNCTSRFWILHCICNIANIANAMQCFLLFQFFFFLLPYYCRNI